MLSRQHISVFGFVLISVSASAQFDTLQLEEVSINSYLGSKPLLRLPSSTALVDSATLARQHGQSLVPALNTVPGVRMEERSPGSYRLSIRGSLIRSPFGVRNVKTYIENFPFTNAGGETYLNLLDPLMITGVEVLKGPDGSLFGVNSGGVIRLEVFPGKTRSAIVNPSVFPRQSQTKLSVGAGSFGYLHYSASVRQSSPRNSLFVDLAQQSGDGYRQHSAMRRQFMQLGDQFRYHNKATLKAYGFFSLLRYQTPGGLTRAQFEADPRHARPSTAFVPGPVEQQAGISNGTFFGGAENVLRFNDRWAHHFLVFGSATDFENPFLTNYETRKEYNAGARSWVARHVERAGVKYKSEFGFEAQHMRSSVNNYDNNKGTRDTLRAGDKLSNTLGFVFLHLSAELSYQFMVEAGISYNYSALVFQRTHPVMQQEEKRTFDPQLMPRLSFSYYFTKGIALRGILSRGYSPPAIQEVRASNTVFNKALQPEQGNNFEIGIRYKSSTITYDLGVFRYQLERAIVRRNDSLGREYFINSGGTLQQGLESQLRLQLLKRNTGLVQGINVDNSITLSDFRFNNPSADAAAYHGKRLPGVPRGTALTSLSVDFARSVYFFIQHYHSSSIMLDDLNSEAAGSYDLVQAKLGYRFKLGFTGVQLELGADNLLNHVYSLGHDLNAFGRRFYNAAPGRNYFARITVLF